MTNPNWPLRNVDELFEIGAGKTMCAAARHGENKTPFLRTSNILWDEVDLANVDEMVMSAADLETRRLRSGDLLVCEGGEIGRAAVWTGEREPMSFQNHLHRLRARTDEVEPHFYVYYLQAAFTRLGIYEGAANKTTIPNLSRNRLARLEVPHPPIGEQRAIAAALAKVRRSILLCRQSARTTQELKCEVMHELFTRGLHGEPQKETEIGPTPEGWTVLPLGELCSIQSGGTPPKTQPELWSGPIPWVSGKDLKQNRLSAVKDYISEAAATNYSKIAPAGSVLVLVRGMGLANGFALSLLEKPMSFNQDLKALIPRGAITGAYLMHALTYAGDRMLQNVTNAAHGTKRLTQDDLDRFLIPVPSAAEQHEIAEMLGALDTKLALHVNKNALLEELFMALLVDLMTGTLRVSDLDFSAVAHTGRPAA